ncbi:MAG: hypothetical protein H7833_05310, partial [Magnetococcus sp. DMHC-1]
GENRNLDIISTPVTSTVAASFAKAAEAQGELIRRTALGIDGTSNEVSQVKVAQYLSRDLSDGDIDGRQTIFNVASNIADADVPTNNLAKMIGVVKAQEATVAFEVVTDQLSVTRSNGNQIAASDVKTNLSTSLAAMVNKNGEPNINPSDMIDNCSADIFFIEIPPELVMNSHEQDTKNY